MTAGASAPDASVRAVIAAVAPSRGVEVLQVTTEGEYFPPRRAFAVSSLPCSRQSRVASGAAPRVAPDRSTRIGSGMPPAHLSCSELAR